MIRGNMQKTYSLLELTLRGLLLGSILTIIFKASNVYLGLKVGFTFSSSIPAVVISMAVLSLFKTSNILENNMFKLKLQQQELYHQLFLLSQGFLCVGIGVNFHFGKLL